MRWSLRAIWITSLLVGIGKDASVTGAVLQETRGAMRALLTAQGSAAGGAEGGCELAWLLRRCRGTIPGFFGQSVRAPRIGLILFPFMAGDLRSSFLQVFTKTAG
jgi:hypothetical protein